MNKNILVIGAGLFGCSIAIELKKAGMNVTLLEKESDIFMGASKGNHNRIHFGFHYPRSIETARESLDGLVLFLMRFKDAIVSDFPNYYFIEKNSRVSSDEYLSFCDEVGITYDMEWPNHNIINEEHIDTSLRVLEPVFDYEVVKDNMMFQLLKYDIDLRLNCEFDKTMSLDYDYVINSAYGDINQINNILDVPKIDVKLQDVIIPIFEMSHEPIGLTIMDGPFCSIMPKGFNKDNFLLYHVDHSVASETFDDNLDRNFNIEEQVDEIYNESFKYYPFLKEVKRIGHWRSLRPLPINYNDERLSEIFYDKSNPKFISVLSGKVSSCWLTALKVKDLIMSGEYK